MIDIRPFNKEHIGLKVKWINNSQNNKYLHYDIPITIEGTKKWFDRIINSNNRLDFIIEYNREPIGLIGLLNIDSKNRKAEYYIVIGENEHKGKNIAYSATLKLFKKAKTLNLKRIYLFTEIENIAAQKLFEKVGFVKEGLLHNDLLIGDEFIHRFVYGYDLTNN